MDIPHVLQGDGQGEGRNGHVPCQAALELPSPAQLRSRPAPKASTILWQSVATVDATQAMGIAAGVSTSRVQPTRTHIGWSLPRGAASSGRGWLLQPCIGVSRVPQMPPQGHRLE